MKRKILTTFTPDDKLKTAMIGVLCAEMDLVGMELEMDIQTVKVERVEEGFAFCTTTLHPRMDVVDKRFVAPVKGAIWVGVELIAKCTTHIKKKTINVPQLERL